MKRISEKTNKKKKLSKKKRIILFFALILSILGIFFIVKAMPVKNVTNKDIKISLSTKKITKKNIDVNIASTKNYSIYYYIDYIKEEDEILNENTLIPEETEENSNDEKIITSSLPKLKDIANKDYKKMTSSSITVENNATIYLKYERFGKYSEKPYTFIIDNIDKEGPEIGEIETTATDSSITVKVNAIDLKNPTLTYYFKLQEDEKYICTETENTYTFKNLTKNQTYSIYIKVIDGFGNGTEVVTDAVASSKQTEEPTAIKDIYHIKVNLAANTVTIYKKDSNGKFTEPIKAMVCSVGKATPKSGTYKISVRYRWRELFGNVYGQYATRIYGNILFHSVPYLNTYPDTLEYDEYDKLGTSASAGCVRLTVEDAKWIYDNAKNGSTVEFYSDKNNPGPLGKPTAQKISGNKANRNWDPTDPDSRNPWNGGNGNVPKVQRQTPPVKTDDEIDSITPPIDNNKIPGVED